MRALKKPTADCFALVESTGAAEMFVKLKTNKDIVANQVEILLIMFIFCVKIYFNG